jgi:hypothetical protein
MSEMYGITYGYPSDGAGGALYLYAFRFKAEMLPPTHAGRNPWLGPYKIHVIGCASIARQLMKHFTHHPCATSLENRYEYRLLQDIPESEGRPVVRA